MPRKKNETRLYSNLSNFQGRSNNSTRDTDPLYKKWRKAVFTRDEHKCQMPGCSYEGKKVSAHHIRKWADYPSQRYIIENGITLCHDCHHKIEKMEAYYVPLLSQVVQNAHPNYEPRSVMPQIDLYGTTNKE